MKPTPPRPENRHRTACDGAPWADTRPQCFRSEAFAEDLPPVEPPTKRRPNAMRAKGRAGAPVFGVVLASALALFGR